MKWVGGTGPEEIKRWPDAIVAKLADGTPRTFNALCVEIDNVTADAAACEAPELALWDLVTDGVLAALRLHCIGGRLNVLGVAVAPRLSPRRRF